MSKKDLLVCLFCLAACKAKSGATESLPSGFFDNKSCGSLRFPEAHFADSGVFYIFNTGNDQLIAKVTYSADKTEDVRNLINRSFVYGCVKSNDWQMEGTASAQTRLTTLTSMDAISDVHKD